MWWDFFTGDENDYGFGQGNGYGLDHGLYDHDIWWDILTILAAASVAIIITRLMLSTVLDWFRRNKVINSGYGALIKQRLATGNYKVVAGVFNKLGVKTASQTWEANELGDDIENYFGNRDHIRVEL